MPSRLTQFAGLLVAGLFAHNHNVAYAWPKEIPYGIDKDGNELPYTGFGEVEADYHPEPIDQKTTSVLQFFRPLNLFKLFKNKEISINSTDKNTKPEQVHLYTECRSPCNMGGYL